MSHRRRFLNLVMENRVTGVHSLRRVDLHSRHNNLFYPTAAAAEDAAAAHDPDVLFSDDRSSAKKLRRIRLAAPVMSFQPTLSEHSSFSSRMLNCAALSEGKTVFMDGHSRGAFLYDADARRVVTLPNHRVKEQLFPICLSVAGAGDEEDDCVYVMNSWPKPAGDPESRFQFQALVHRKKPQDLSWSNDWRCVELPSPPYVRGVGYKSTSIGSYGLVDGKVCISTKGIGTYCFDTASRKWSKAGDWALPFAGKIERDKELGLWVGFLDTYYDEEPHSLCASGDLLSAVDSCSCRPMRCGDACQDLEPWYKSVAPQIIGLGSGKFCVVQFFRTMVECCCDSRDEKVDKFLVFTGVEVTRHVGGDELTGNGSANGKREGELRMIFHKSKRYMLVDDSTTVRVVV
ncbi:hypothetical protein ACP70R_021502 [Stipagrostis hirtigluma subsp. patula]